jgi:lipid-A-disaccharide synthase
MRIFFSVGEPSGDLHAANLIAALRARQPDVEFLGLGGPKMAAAGCHLLFDMTQLAVMGLFAPLANLARFWRVLRHAKASLRDQRPDAVLLIDYPGFNWHVAAAAKALGIPVFYYGLPQLWAWMSWRVKKMRRLVDHALCMLPFEEQWFRDRGIEAHYVGHAYFDELSHRKLDESFLADERRRPGPLIALLPGSRAQAVKNNLASMLTAARLVRRQVPAVRFAVAAYNDSHAEMARSCVAAAGLDADVFSGRTHELMQLSHSCLACSGSVSLELLHYARPTVIQYRMNPLLYTLLDRLHLIKVRYITLVNLMAAQEKFCDKPKPFDPAAPGARDVPFPEYPSYTDKSHQIAAHLVEWLTDSSEYARRVAQLRDLRARFGGPGASRKAADYMLSALGKHTRRARAA